MGISLDLGRIWPDEVYVEGVYHHTRPSSLVCMTSMYVYLEYMVILILYATIIVLYNILKNMCSFEKKIHVVKIWSILILVRQHTQTDKWVCTHTQRDLVIMGVTTPGSIKNAPFSIYDIIYAVSSTSGSSCCEDYLMSF